ncbi:MAG: D-glycero-beta-D-manno-heptose-7-phosphate kinase [Rhodospirillaceae bacterium]
MDPSASLVDLVETLHEVRILCLGDVMLDRFVEGVVERISPEAPIPIIKIKSEQVMLGGSGNVVRNLVALGGRAAFLSVIGEDRTGKEIMTLLSDFRELDCYITVETGRRTPMKIRYFAGSQQLLRADEETIKPISESNRDQLLADATRQIEDASCLILSDYGKGTIADDTAARLIEIGRRVGKPVIVDPKGRDFGRYRGATVITPNKRELSEATGLLVDSHDDVITAARRIIDTCGIDNVLATRSQEGMSLIGRDGSIEHFPAEAREVFDVSGAGDTVVATLAAALGAGSSLSDAARLANVAAGIVVGRVGTASVPARDLINVLHRREISHTGEKVAGMEEAVALVEKWRRRGLRVGFTNGCFDLLHPGHVSLLRQARAACDRLVVGLNTDASVRKLKGPSRPVQNESARATVLASMATVDLVVPFSDNTPIRLIEALKPSVLVKGADYTVETVVGAEFVQSYGGKVVLAALEDGFSTTATIARLNS